MKSEQTEFMRLLGGLSAGASDSWYINIPHCLSMMNRKSFHQVNADGSIKQYGLAVSVFNMVNGSTSIYTGRLGYMTENATRAWHFARKDRFNDAGFALSDLGYGSRMRFALDKTHTDLNQSTTNLADGVLAPFTNTVTARGEWDWSEVIITPPVNIVNDAVEAQDLADTFYLHLIGDHTVTSSGGETIKYSHVGMVQSYAENLRGVALPTAEEAVQPENPLAFARMSETASLLITEEVSDEQKQAPPYSNLDDDDDLSVFATATISGNLETAFPSVTTNDTMVVAPGGVAKITITNNDSASAYPFIRVNMVEL